MPAARKAHRGPAGRPIERLGHRGSPVDHHWLLALVRDREPPDVEGLPGVTVDAAEHQSRIADLEVGEPVPHRLFDHVALVASLVGAASPDLGQSAQPKCELTGPFEAVVGTIDVGLLCGELGVLRHRPSRGFKGGNSHEGENNRSGAGRQTYGTMAR